MTATSTEPVYTPDSILTLDEAAAYLKIPKATIYTWRSRRPGFGPKAVRSGGGLRYRFSDLVAWVESRLEDFDEDGKALHEEDSERGKHSWPEAPVVIPRRSRNRTR